MYEDFFTINEILFYESNVSIIGSVLYMYFSFYVVMAALILLVAMIGAIVLTVDFEYRPIIKSNRFTYRITRDELKYWS